MAFETLALGILLFNITLIVIIVFFLVRGTGHRSKKKNKGLGPLEYELLQHGDPEEFIRMRMMQGDDLDDPLTQMMLREMMYNSRQGKGASVIENIKESRQTISKDQVKQETKEDIMEEVKKEIKRRL